MDDYMFREHVSKCRQVTEATHYVEILNYSVRARLSGLEEFDDETGDTSCGLRLSQLNRIRFTTRARSIL